MARLSERVKAYSKGKTSKGYWGTEHLKDLLWDICRTHKTWGHKWYDLARLGCYDAAKVELVLKGKGECRNKALDIIDELIERGDE